MNGNIACSLSTSAKYIATLAENGAIVVWNVASREKLAVCLAKSESKRKADNTYSVTPATGLCFDAKNESILYFCNAQGLQSWHWQKKERPKLIYQFIKPPFGPSVMAMGASPDGRHVSFVDSFGNLDLFIITDRIDLIFHPSGRELPQQGGYDGLAFVPQSTEMIWKEGRFLKSIDLNNPKKVAVLADSRDVSAISSFAFLPTGKQLVLVNQEGEIHWWSLSSGKKILLEKRLTESTVISVSPDGRLVITGEGSGMISVFSLQDKKKLSSL